MGSPAQLASIALRASPAIEGSAGGGTKAPIDYTSTGTPTREPYSVQEPS